MINSDGIGLARTHKNKKILFITGTRADFGKLKPLMHKVSESTKFDFLVFVTGMHMLSLYGLTENEVRKAGFKNIRTFINQMEGEPMEIILANTINGLSRYVHEYQPDMIIVHGDRLEALAGAIVGALRNILVAHVEGGERSGTIDESIRHTITKLSHIHFVANKDAANRVKQLGENPKSIHIIGSPDIDIMLSPNLPSLEIVKQYYEIPFDNYGIAIFHPITTELNRLPSQVNEFVSALLEIKNNYVVIYPNNDPGSKEILSSYECLKGKKQFRIIPSMRFEYFLILLKHADFIIGNSSSGIREAPLYAVYTINVGNRQKNRFENESIINVNCLTEDIVEAIKKINKMPKLEPCIFFGDGKSAEHFILALEKDDIWSTPRQKEFWDSISDNKNEKK